MEGRTGLPVRPFSFADQNLLVLAAAFRQTSSAQKHDARDT
jgi:hypothetical protein